ncbi:MAG: patatin-like phospholipase family protein, partial [Verrucomicrobiota bacterium]|nr:patatin-like phospholipase family protein [Verrucomicrobiota bacterium]
MPSGGRHRILSLDGGGSWALIEVRALLALYGDVSGREVLSKFDLVSANSGGSIVAAALAGGWKLSEIL